MSSLSSLPDIVFVDASAEEVENTVISAYEAASERTLAKADPVRLFLLTIANVIVLLKNDINYTGKQNLLRYAEGDSLDHLGVLVGCERTAAAAASTTIKVTLSEAQATNIVIPAGTRFTAGDNVFFALDDLMLITAGELTGTGQATCTETGTVGNDYLPGQIKTLVDPVAYVSSIVNTTKSEGGAEIESDDDYREDINKAPESFSVAGPKGAYEYWAKRASSTISDVSVLSPSPGTVEVIPLLENGVIPGTEILSLVDETLNDLSVRPLTDRVIVAAPTAETYDIDLTYYIEKDNATRASAIQEAVNNAVEEYISWQCAKLARDINPSELIKSIVTAGAKRVVINSPVFTALDETKVAQLGTKTINFGGLEDA